MKRAQASEESPALRSAAAVSPPSRISFWDVSGCLQTRPKAASYLSVGDSIEGLKAQFGEAEGASQVELIEVLIDQTEFQPNRTLCPLLIV